EVPVAEFARIPLLRWRNSCEFRDTTSVGGRSPVLDLLPGVGYTSVTPTPPLPVGGHSGDGRPGRPRLHPSAFASWESSCSLPHRRRPSATATPFSTDCGACPPSTSCCSTSGSA